jgi:hypothetical protein
MRLCPYCGYSNIDGATECHKCQSSLVINQQTLYTGKRHLVSPLHAKYVRDRGLAALILGLMIKVYWGGYGPWPVIDNPTLVDIRPWLQPLLIYGGIAIYAVGWILNWF